MRTRQLPLSNIKGRISYLEKVVEQGGNEDLHPDFANRWLRHMYRILPQKERNIEHKRSQKERGWRRNDTTPES